MKHFNTTFTASVLALSLLFAGNAFADGHSRSGGATVTTDAGKTYDINHQASTDGNGNYSKSTTVNGKEIRSVDGGNGSRTITHANGHSRHVTRSK